MLKILTCFGNQSIAFERKLIVIILCLFTILMYGCSKPNNQTHPNLAATSEPTKHHASYYVTAENGLTVREAPRTDAKKVYKLAYGQKITSLSKYPDQFDLIETQNKTNTKISGQWLQVDLSQSNTLMHSQYINEATPGFVLGWSGEKDTTTSGYVFDGYMMPAKDFETHIINKLHQFPELQHYTLATDAHAFHMMADMFGDGVKDDVIKARTLSGETHIIMLDHSPKIPTQSTYHILNNPSEGTRTPEDYSWDGYFQRVHKGTVLYSNYTDDFRDLDNVPENERVILNHDALYVHIEEGCGGAFIFWKDGKFNWLQQE